MDKINFDVSYCYLYYYWLAINAMHWASDHNAIKLYCGMHETLLLRMYNYYVEHQVFYTYSLVVHFFLELQFFLPQSVIIQWYYVFSYTLHQASIVKHLRDDLHLFFLVIRYLEPHIQSLHEHKD